MGGETKQTSGLSGRQGSDEQGHAWPGRLSKQVASLAGGGISTGGPSSSPAMREGLRVQGRAAPFPVHIRSHVPAGGVLGCHDPLTQKALS